MFENIESFPYGAWRLKEASVTYCGTFCRDSHLSLHIISSFSIVFEDYLYICFDELNLSPYVSYSCSTKHCASRLYNDEIGIFIGKLSMSSDCENRLLDLKNFFKSIEKEVTPCIIYEIVHDCYPYVDESDKVYLISSLIKEYEC